MGINVTAGVVVGINIVGGGPLPLATGAPCSKDVDVGGPLLAANGAPIGGP